MGTVVLARAGVLAAAVGAGVLIGLASATPASADAESATRSGPASDNQPAAPQRRGQSAERSAPAAHRSPRPAATVVTRTVTTPVTPSVRSASGARTTAPETAVPVEPARPNQPAPVVVAPAPAAATIPATPAKSLGSLFCDPRGRLITIYKGTHFAIPNSFGYFIKQVKGTGTFTPNTVYDLKDEDQYDWNKFTGIAFTPLEPDRNSAMVGWRYNLNTKEFEIAPFYNVDKKRILPNELTEVIAVPADQTFTYTVDYTGITVSYGDKTVYKPYPDGLKPNVWTAARVSGWFGGNEVAPRTVSYYLKIK